MDVTKVVDAESISGWYKQQNVFVTGGSGFLGKAVIFKLLQVGCPRIYVLMRPKRNQDPESRLDAIIKHEIYDSVREKDPEIRSKVTAIAGDITEPNLGISDSDRQLLCENVTVVFHGAASVKFDDPLRKAVDNNLRPTRDLCELATQMKNLKIFNYISTGYSNCEYMMWASGLEEKIYERKMDWRKLIEFVDNSPDELVNAVEKKITGASPNTYIFTKHLAEAVIEDYAKRVPIVITRPPVVNPSYREPYAGWMDNISSPVAIVGGCGKGVLRLYIGTPHAKKSYIPADFSINSNMVAAWHEAQNYEKGINQDVPVYNQDSVPLTSAELKYYCFKSLETNPITNPLWNTHFYHIDDPFYFDIAFFFLHFIPGLLIDALLKISGQKPRMQRIYRKIYGALYALLPILNLNDNFIIDNNEKLKELIPENEKDIWYLDTPKNPKIFQEYIISCCYGFRKLIGDPPYPTERDFVIQRRLKWLDYACQFTIVALFLWFFPLRIFFFPFLYIYNSFFEFVASI